MIYFKKKFCSNARGIHLVFIYVQNHESLTPLLILVLKYKSATHMIERELLF